MQYIDETQTLYVGNIGILSPGSSKTILVRKRNVCPLMPDIKYSIHL